MSSGRGRARHGAQRTRCRRRGLARYGWRTFAAAALALLIVPPVLLGANRGAPGRADPRLQLLGDEFVARPLAPTVTALTLAEELAWIRGFRERLAAVPHDEAAGERASERDLLDAAVDRDLLELEVLRPFQRDPGAYVALVAGSVETALDRSNGSSCARLHRAALRLAEVPEVLRAARLNLKNPPRVLTELAIERFAGVLRFYREDVPRLTAGCRSARMQADIAQADTIAVRAVAAFLSYLETDLLPVSRGEPAIGPDACRRLLRSALVAEVAPIETLLAEGARLVETRRAELEALATLVAPGGVRAALDSLASERPLDGDAVAHVRRGVGRVEQFLRTREVVSIPARMDPIASAGAAVGGAALGRLNRWETDLAVAHEGLPGRDLRAVALRGASSRLRRALQESWPGEDWGQYCEQMMLDEGYGGDDPRYRLAGAVRALRHAGRALAALALHAGAMSEDEARRMLEDRCLLNSAEAVRETRWAAADPALMGYTLGAQRLRELQEEARQRLGPRFRTRAFHDAVLRCGASPPGIVRDRLWLELADAAGAKLPGARP